MNSGAPGIGLKLADGGVHATPQPSIRLPELVLRSRRALSVGGQLLLVMLSNALAFWLRFDGSPPLSAVDSYWQMVPWLVAIRMVSFVPFRLYEGLWRYTSLYDLQALISGISLSSLVFYGVLRSPLGSATYPRTVVAIDALILVIMLGGIRLSRRVVAEWSRTRRQKRVLIVGAGDNGEIIVRNMKTNYCHPYCPIGFIDDDRSKLGRRIHGVPVLGNTGDLRRIVARHRPDEVLIAISRSKTSAVRSIVRTLESCDVVVKTLPNLRDLIDGKLDLGRIRRLSFEDLLARAPIGLDARPVRRLIAGRRVMITGAGGSIGSELCRQIARLKPASLIMLDRYENGLHAIQLELRDEGFRTGLFPVVGDITDRSRIDELLGRYQPEIVFHAAAHKHVPLMEDNPCEAIKNNVRGTRLIAEAADRHGVDRFIFISSDKAVNPTSVMGASKRVAELVIQGQSTGSGSSFSIVRFGNVLGSNGSVVPRFLEQIRKGGPVTVTDPEVRRFFMLTSEAVQLVLHAASRAEKGGTYVLEMGEPVKLADMARDLIRFAGLTPGVDVDIEFIGLRPGEKLSEELIGADETVAPSGVEQVLCVISTRQVPSGLSDRVAGLERAADKGDAQAVLARLRELVGDFEPQKVGDEHSAVTLQVTVQSADDAFACLCPKCHAHRLRRWRVRSMPDRLRKHFTAERLFRCGACGWRGWLPPPERADGEWVDAPSPPDLSSLDFAVQSTVGARPIFAPRDLE